MRCSHFSEAEEAVGYDSLNSYAIVRPSNLGTVIYMLKFFKKMGVIYKQFNSFVTKFSYLNLPSHTNQYKENKWNISDYNSVKIESSFNLIWELELAVTALTDQKSIWVKGFISTVDEIITFNNTGVQEPALPSREELHISKFVSKLQRD